MGVSQIYRYFSSELYEPYNYGIGKVVFLLLLVYLRPRLKLAPIKVREMRLLEKSISLALNLKQSFSTRLFILRHILQKMESKIFLPIRCVFFTGCSPIEFALKTMLARVVKFFAKIAKKAKMAQKAEMARMVKSAKMAKEVRMAKTARMTEIARMAKTANMTRMANMARMAEMAQWPN